MTNPNRTLIAGLIDRSGSMITIKDDTEGGWKTFLDSQRDDLKEGESIEVWLSDFDTEYQKVYSGTDIREVPDYTLTPRGWTALVDSMYRMISEIGSELEGRDEDDRPGTVLFVTLTDGEENASVEVKPHQLRDKIKEQTDKYGWNFVFLGANIDAVGVAKAYGIDAGSALQYGANAAGVEATFQAVSRYAMSTRGGAPMAKAAFTDAERDAANTDE